METMDCDMAASAQQPSSSITSAGTLGIGAQEEVGLMPPPSSVPHAILPPGVLVGSIAPPSAPPTQQENPYCLMSNFDIEKRIGRGQFSVVYKAKCRLNDSVVALKKVQVTRRICAARLYY